MGKHKFSYSLTAQEHRHFLPRTHMFMCAKSYQVHNKMPCYRRDDHAMRPMYGCPENFRESLSMSTATFPEVLNELLFRSILWMWVQNLKSVALPVPEIIGGQTLSLDVCWKSEDSDFWTCSNQQHHCTVVAVPQNIMENVPQENPNKKQSQSTEADLRSIAFHVHTAWKKTITVVTEDWQRVTGMAVLVHSKKKTQHSVNKKLSYHRETARQLLIHAVSLR